LGPLLFLACINDIWRNLESTFKLYVDICIIYRKVMNDGDRHVADRSGQTGGVGYRKYDENKSR